ncbi:ABC transporter permease [Thermopolyspora flexuosa]|jgi:spermidine/putrescine transport system permease protein|uniref:Spermidine/putrescine transport system permease protein n=1 Tax=Thermopolyspora flexuosa TaxID=103836 RepID=A0A543J112_9ACTN|nr:ABC transporter permease [Thermopolyspora flexuosa]TQM76511.1 spermidine/putrescine transport system permease protein [Thermopolyspora flexuosa]GGM84814.1 ABC transporter permease [Thermopolyspora flexuosa]
MKGSRLRAALTPYLLILPGGLWLAIFFVVPMIVMLSLSLQSGNIVDGFAFTWNWRNYLDGIANHHDQMIRSIGYGLAATVITIVVGFPVAYWIAFRGGRRKNMYLLLLLMPFLVSFVLRTISWQFFLADDGVLLGPLKRIGLLPEDFHILATGTAVVLGLAYNFLPFMVLPIYVALERIDPRILEAAADLYANRVQTFLRVVLPLSLPGVFAGVLMTFVPACSDYVNASILGGATNTMIGNVIQNQYLVTQDYPVAAALSFTLMAVLLIGIFAYARALGSEEVLEVTAR